MRRPFRKSTIDDSGLITYARLQPLKHEFPQPPFLVRRKIPMRANMHGCAFTRLRWMIKTLLANSQSHSIQYRNMSRQVAALSISLPFQVFVRQHDLPLLRPCLQFSEGRSGVMSSTNDPPL